MNPELVTIRQLAGLSDKPAPLSESAVLVIDAQKEYTEGKLPLAGINQSITVLAKFLDRARKASAPIVHIIQVSKPGGKIFNPETPMVQIIDKIKPADGEIVIEKKLPSAFTGTTLETELTKIGRKDLIVTGYMTHMCLNSTTRDAAEKGYRCTVVAELTATRDLPGRDGAIIPADIVKAVNLATLADRFAIVVDHGDDIR
jgi:nicotinamidase-related amidase